MTYFIKFDVYKSEIKKIKHIIDQSLRDRYGVSHLVENPSGVLSQAISRFSASVSYNSHTFSKTRSNPPSSIKVFNIVIVLTFIKDMVNDPFPSLDSSLAIR